MKKIKNFPNSLVALAAFVFIAGCASKSSNQNLNLQSAQPYASQAGQMDGIPPEYLLGFGDIIDIKFFRNTEFNETVTVRPDGRISLQKVGEIFVAGMTPMKLDSIVTKAYDSFVINPDVTIIVRQFSGSQVFVLGQVKQPGGFQLQKNMNVLQAIALAGGALQGAKLNSVMLLRRKPDSGIEAKHINLDHYIKSDSGALLADSELFVYGQDIIYVPKTTISSAADFMNMVYSGFLPPLDLYLRATLYYDRL